MKWNYIEVLSSVYLFGVVENQQLITQKHEFGGLP
jgi:hypothetical protein